MFDAESSFAAVDRKAKNLIGLILCSRVRGDVGHVTQVCVLPEYRSRGIGEVASGRDPKQSSQARLLYALV